MLKTKKSWKESNKRDKQRDLFHTWNFFVIPEKRKSSEVMPKNIERGLTIAM